MIVILEHSEYMEATKQARRPTTLRLLCLEIEVWQLDHYKIETWKSKARFRIR